MIKVNRMSIQWLTEPEMQKVIRMAKQKKKFGWKDIAFEVEEEVADHTFEVRRGQYIWTTKPVLKGKSYYHLTIEYVV